MMQATNLKTNHLSAPLGMDAGTLFYRGSAPMACDRLPTRLK